MWLPHIGGSTTFPAGTGSSINVDASQILDTLKFTFMGTFEAQKGRWGVYSARTMPPWRREQPRLRHTESVFW